MAYISEYVSMWDSKDRAKRACYSGIAAQVAIHDRQQSQVAEKPLGDLSPIVGKGNKNLHLPLSLNRRR